MIAKPPHVIVVGAGIIGASFAYHIARQKARVTLIDNAPKPATGATERSFGWINVRHDAPEAYITLRQQAIVDWHRLEDDLKDHLKIDWSGALTWLDDSAETEHIVRRLVNFGYQARLVDHQEIRRLEPNLKSVPPVAMFAENEGAIDPALTTELLITAARQAGAVIQLGNEVLALMTNGSRVTGVSTATGKLTADMVVLAAGINVVTLCQSVDVVLPINPSPAILMAFDTHQFVNRIVSNPFMEIRAASEVLTLSAEDYVDESIENNPQAIAQRTLKKMKEHWQGTEQIKLASIAVGKRPIPQDGLPIIGRTTSIEGLYVAVMHAGVTLAAIAGRLATTDILSDQENALLSPYRPIRFD